VSQTDPFKTVDLCDIAVSVNSLNERLAHVRISMTVTEVGMVLLCLAGVSDDCLMFAALSSLADSSPTAPVDSDRWLDAQERDYLIALHYLTHVAHVLVLCHDGPALDVAAMRALRSVQLLRNANRATIDEFMRTRESAFGTIAVNSYLPGFITPVLLTMFAIGDDDVADFGMPEGVIFLRMRTLETGATSRPHARPSQLSLAGR
jgi:hypothetical protein